MYLCKLIIPKVTICEPRVGGLNGPFFTLLSPFAIRLGVLWAWTCLRVCLVCKMP